MDFIVGILIVFIIILILINFSSISISDTKGNTCSRNNLSLGNQTMNINSIPSPMLSKEPSALNNKLKLNAQTYDYNKYFFL
jgi:hypothetical protein